MMLAHNKIIHAVPPRVRVGSAAVPALLERYRELRRALPPVFWTLCLGTLINRAGNFVVPLLSFYLIRARGMSLADAGAIVSMFGAGQLLAALAGGVLCDRIGRRATMAISLLGGSVLMLALGLARAPAAIAACGFAVGFTGDLFRPAVQAAVVDVVPPGERVRAYGWLYLATNLGYSIAPVVAGLVAGYSYLLLFVGDAVTTAIFGAIVLARVPETRPERPAGATGSRIGLIDVFRDRVFMTFWALTFFVALIFFQHIATLPGWMAAQGHGERTFGLVIACNGLMVVALQQAVTVMARRFERSRTLALAALLFGAGFALHGASTGIGVHLAAVALWTLGEVIMTPATSATVADLAPVEARGRYQGVFTMAWGLASFTGPLLGPRVLAAGGPIALWGGCLALGAVAALGFLSTSPARRDRPAAVPA